MYGINNIDTQTIVIQNKQRPLAPAPERLSFNGKRKFTNYVGMSSQQPTSVARRNARERNRVKQVNNGFAALRQHIPTNVLAAFGVADTSVNSRTGSKKLSKVETLKVAVEYIKSLQNMLEEHQENGAERMVDYFVDSPDSGTQQYSPYSSTMPTPPASVTSASPTPSHNSEIATYQPTMIFIQNGFKEFEPKGPDDEELLDAIFSWQQSQ